MAASQVLAALLVCPDKGGVLGRLAWALGRGIGEYLLQQAQWVLQVCCPQQPAQGLASCHVLTVSCSSYEHQEAGPVLPSELAEKSHETPCS